MIPPDQRALLSPGQRLVLVVGPVLTAAGIIGTQLVSSPTWIRVFDNLHWTAAYAAAAMLTWLGCRRARGAVRRARGWYVTGLGAYAIGQMLWDVQVATGWNPFPGPSDAFYILLAPCLILGLLSQVHGLGRAERVAMSLDCAGFVVAALTLTLGLYLPRGPVGAFKTAVLVAYPVLWLGAAGIAAIVLLRLRLRLTGRFAIFWLALVANGLLWMEWNRRTIDGTLADGVLLNFGFSVGALILGVGAAIWDPELLPLSQSPRAYQRLGRILPLLFAVAGALAIGFSSGLPPISRTVAHLGSLTVVVIAVLRQSLLLGERDESLATERAAREREERFRLRAEDAEQRSQFLAAASAVLSESLDYATRLAALARLCVESLADWCVIDIVHDNEISRAASAHRDPAKNALLEELELRCPPTLVSPQHVDEEHARLLRALGTEATLSVPLSVRGAVIGVIGLYSTTPGRYGQAERELALELGRRAAVAIDNARLYREAQQAVRLRDEFLSIASHELKTPITSLELAIYNLKKGGSPGAMAQSVTLVDRQEKRLMRLVNELLDVSRIVAGRIHIEIEDVDLAAIARDVSERFAAELVRAGGSLRLHADQPVVGRWDPIRLDQVVTNLVANAIKFGASGPIEISVDVQGETARLVVRDQGIGIPPDRLAHIFERFERGVSARAYGGLGLGLYIARSIVEALGGTIRAESVLGAGATFTVELPRSR